MNPPTISSRPLARDTEPISTRRTLGCQRYKQIKEKGKRVPRWPGFSYSEACLACPGKRRTCYTKPGLVEHATKKDGERMERRRGVNKWTDDGWWMQLPQVPAGSRTVRTSLNPLALATRSSPPGPALFRRVRRWTCWDTMGYFHEVARRKKRRPMSRQAPQWWARETANDLCRLWLEVGLLEKHTDTSDGHAMAGGDVPVDCGALSYEVNGAGLV